jgi:hypothetical protein
MVEVVESEGDARLPLKLSRQTFIHTFSQMKLSYDKHQDGILKAYLRI